MTVAGRERLRSIADCVDKSYPERWDPELPPHTAVELNEGEWWACAHPERPADDGVWWDERCPACCIAYEATRATDPSFGIWFLGALRPVRHVALIDGEWALDEVGAMA